MANSAKRSGFDLFSVNNSDGGWKVRSYIADWCELSNAIDIATVFIS